jgi:cobalt-zinc-cadmium efflux system membrane fusion protein
MEQGRDTEGPVEGRSPLLAKSGVSEAPHDPPVRRLPRGVQVALIAAGAGVLASWVLLSSLSSKSEPAAASSAVPSDSFKPTAEQWAGFKTAEVRMISFSASEITDGKIATDDDLTTAVYSPYTGRVTKLFVKAGDEVKAGDPLLAIQANEFVQGSNDLVAALATFGTTKAQLANAAITEKRQHELYLAQGGALKDWQQSQSDLANARGAFNSAEVALGAVRNRLRILGKTDREVAAMETAVDPTRFSPETIVQAPIGGTVMQRQVGLGQNIATQANGGSTPVFTIADTSRVWLMANAREMDAPQIHLGDAVEVHVLAFPGRVFNAKIAYVAASIDATTHRLPIHAEIANTDDVLKPEMFATFRIITGRANDAPAVPQQAIVYDDDGTHVWLAGPDKTLSIRKVKTGRDDAGMVEVLDGLKPGDTVVTSGSLFIDRAAEAG